MSKIEPSPEKNRDSFLPRDGTNPDPRCFRIRKIVDTAYHNERLTGQPALTEDNIEETQRLLFDIMDELIQLRNNSELPPGYKSRRAIGLLKSWRNGDTKDQQETLEALEGLLVGEHGQLADKAKEIGVTERTQQQYELYREAVIAEAYRRHPWLLEFEKEMNKEKA
jgi:hypothetical protein